MTDTKPKRRWFRYSLRALLVFVVVVSVPLTWFAWKMERARRQRKAVEAIGELGGAVHYDYQEWLEAEAEAPGWLSELLGEDFVHDVTSIDLADSQITDDGLVHLNRFTRLQGLSLAGTPISDAGLAHLNTLTSLKRLSLIGTQVTDAGLAELRELDNLKMLYLYDTEVTDDGAEMLQRALPDTRIEHGPLLLPSLRGG